MPTSKTLILMRHAKSAYPGGVSDHDRPLAERGRHEAGLAGRWLRAELPPIDAVLCSTALRTQQTVALARVEAPIRLAHEIYEATPDDILAQIRATATSVGTLLVVGHAPGMPGLALELARADSAGPAIEQLRAQFPTSAIAVLKSETSWVETDLGEMELTRFHIPRDRPAQD